MKMLLLICCLLLYATTQAAVPNEATHSFTVTVDTATETSTNYLHQIDLTDYFTISAIDSIIDSTKNVVVCPADDTTKYPKYVIYDSSKTCLLYFDAPRSSTTHIDYKVFMGTGLSGANSTSTFTNNNIDNYYGIDNFSGNTYYDYVGNNNGTGTGVDTVTSVFGIGGGYGGSSDNIGLGVISAMQSTDKFTFELCFNPATLTGVQILFYSYTSTANRVYLALVDDAFRILFTNSLGTAYGDVDLSGIVSIGENHNVTVRYDGTGVANSDKIKIYIDGSSKTVAFTGTIDDSTGTLTGVSYLAYTSSAFEGVIDEFNILTEVKSSEYATDRYRTLFDTTFYSVGTIENVPITISTIKINSIYGTGTFSAEPDSIYFNSVKGVLSDSSTTYFTGTPATALGYGTHDMSLYVGGTEFPFTYILSSTSRPMNNFLRRIFNFNFGW